MSKQIFTPRETETLVLPVEINIICEPCSEIMTVDSVEYAPFSLRVEHYRKYVCPRCEAYYLQDMNEEPYPRIVFRKKNHVDYLSGIFGS